jgi:triosephosphate isomerase
MTRATWVLGNWKQNHGPAAAAEVAAAMAAGLDEARANGSVRVGVAPTYVALGACAPHCGDDPGSLQLLAQNVGTHESGAYTGEIGPSMLGEVGVGTVIIGHSERRHVFGETLALIAARTASAVAAGMTVVLCCGETLEQRDAGRHAEVVIEQLSSALDGLEPSAWERVVIAYEPVWAIGTGRTATPDQAGAMHGTIREWLSSANAEHGADRSILYGGSVKAANAADLIAQAEIDGFLVGGASLAADTFLPIVAAVAAARG